MAAISTYLSNALLSEVLGNIAFTSPTTLYVALGTTTQNSNNGGTEVTGNLYSRQPITFTTPASNQSIANTTAPSFFSLPSCTIQSISIFDAATNGNLLFYDNVTPVVIANGTTFTVPISSISVGLT